MAIVRDLIQTKGGQVWSIAPEATVYQALQLLADKKVGALLVMSDNKIKGILSERDCVRKVDLVGKASRTTKVSEIMTSSVLYVEASQPLEECMAVMTEKRVRHLPVFDDGKLVGMVSIGDVLKEIISEQKIIISHLERYITGGPK
jgi:CBS domain-containing protein